ncbi:MAG: hypothetical protein K8I00_02485, partial [Candidatus Omnitrophica bacterium]|nr:hypothetical protein [Candidatus Omnitrophota bacterium]
SMDQIYGRQIQEYARENPATFKQIIAAAIQFEYDTPHAYDHRWINLHGMHVAQTLLAAQQGVSLNDPRPMSYPQEEWGRIQRQTVQDYTADMKQLVHSWESLAP